MKIGDAAPPFNLPGVDGKNHTLESFAGSPALVVMFTCNHCPYVQAYEERLIAIQRDYKDRSVALIAINSNDAVKYPEDRFEEMVKRAQAKGYNFPYLRDETQAVAKAYGAQRTPHIFVFDKPAGSGEASDSRSHKARGLQYMGRVDDNWEHPDKVKRHDLRLALDAILDGKRPLVAETLPVGCSVKWK